MPGFPNKLSFDERVIITRVSEGKRWVREGRRPTAEQLADPDFVKKMPVIRAEVIRALCLGERNGGAKPDPLGIEIIGDRIIGKLDLSFATIEVPLGLIACHFAKQPNFMQANLALLALSGSRLENGFKADRINIHGNLFCHNIFSHSEIRLLGADIGGDVYFNDANIENKNGKALSADRIKIAGNFSCQGIISQGQIRGIM
jgi:hypothetical protein